MKILHECNQYDNCINLDVAVLQGMKSSDCVCPGDILTYKCTIMSSFFGATVWTGGALSSTCPYIFLLHNRFHSIKQCDNGTIVARSLSVEGNNYTSQLNVTITPNIIGKTVVCGYDNGTQYSIQHSIVIPSSGLSSCIDVDTTN